jgi:hypothetical protein
MSEGGRKIKTGLKKPDLYYIIIHFAEGLGFVYGCAFCYGMSLWAPPP